MNTPQEVLDRIEQFYAENEDATFSIQPGYEFEHIVLGDYNLQDDSIRFCLVQADRWFEEEIESLKRAHADDPLFVIAGKQAFQTYKDKATAFLHSLLAVPEDIRIDAEWLEHEGEILA